MKDFKDCVLQGVRRTLFEVPFNPSVLRKNEVRFFCKGGEILKEALDRIHQAELDNEKKRQETIAKVKDYQVRKDLEIQAFVDELKNKRVQQIKDEEQKEQSQLEQKKTLLLKESEQMKKMYHQQYEDRHERIVREILERVKQTYGS